MRRGAVRGWCPGAWQPMRSGDGLIVRIRPRMAALSRAQALGLADLAERHGNGFLELTNRANLQIRGVAETSYAPLLEGLQALDLLDVDAAQEGRRNIVTSPFWRPGDLVDRAGRAMLEAVPDLPDLPAKFGFAVDCGSRPVLSGTSADIRIEAGISGGLIVRADGAATGRPVGAKEAVAAALELAQWFAAHRGERRRMRELAREVPDVWQQDPPVPGAATPHPGAVPEGLLAGAPFGLIRAALLARSLAETKCQELRVTPWRILLFRDIHTVDNPELVTLADSPLMAVHACPGAPHCEAATVETRALAAALAARVGGALHVSGCAKGCAHPKPAARTLVGREGAFDLVTGGQPWDEPSRRGLSAAALLDGSEPI